MGVNWEGGLSIINPLPQSLPIINPPCSTIRVANSACGKNAEGINERGRVKYMGM